ncbi:MAG: CRISPR-associated endonuclease Cas2 [Nitrospirae bacterium]|nr:MAG: CRISPR-associated endonuclease Cas2 [Nitrospirota bacterium]
MKANYLVCYDIKNERRLARVYRLVKQYGIHTQYSVFFCRFTWEELLNMKEKIARLIDAKKDDVRIYPLPSELKVIVMGCGDRVPDGVNIFLE